LETLFFFIQRFNMNTLNVGIVLRLFIVMLCWRRCATSTAVTTTLYALTKNKKVSNQSLNVTVVSNNT